ncbi:DNA-directed RNA polymerase subunit RPC12/RpoP [Cupriavidus necator]|nr:DNA-directed RNA polymerase subunit RPC12/RpoP [Cupriavidus necator]
MFVCGNQACGARWQQDEVQIRDEGQGLVFRCPQCGARNHVMARTKADGTTSYRQVPAKAAEKPAAKRPVKVPAKAPARATPRGRAKHGA